MSAAKAVYVIEGGGRVKVGISFDPQRRLTALRTANPDALVLRASVAIPAGIRSAAIENAAHRILAPHRLSGEWFSCSSDEALAAIRTALEEAIDKINAIAPERKRGNKPAGDFNDFLDRHNLSQAEFASWLGTDKGTVWRWTLPSDDPNSRTPSVMLRAFCIAYDMMTPALRATLVARLRDVK